MSWIVEQSENTCAVNVNGDTITCQSNSGYGSPINVMFKDPADKNGQYFWQIDIKDLDEKSCGIISVGLTTDQGFKDGWGLKAMKYLGNLSDGSGLLVQSFGNQIKKNDKVEILLQLNEKDLKMYLFHNDRPLGLAFHIQSPYPKPLYPVVSFEANGQVKISRSQQIPSRLNRTGLQYNGVEGHWKIVDYPQHPECDGCQLEIKVQDDDNKNIYHIHARVVNSLNCGLEYNSSSNQWKSSHVMSTKMLGPPEEMKREDAVSSLISSIQNLEVQGQEQLSIRTNNGEQIRLERFEKSAPSAVTQNIFN
ncbi:unnamed protein product [Adineta steineri]|uniref:B30.2/SPRY domain-containing protein n=1 Tax=Adineta steineri TaxID=433720 RepID=A0A815L6V2_9BILA|nr:unnamed protein product [Adineta steineri]CAF1405108.1 unnamed protein product [Adineta steineri]